VTQFAILRRWQFVKFFSLNRKKKNGVFDALVEMGFSCHQ
jgi:hypothetical protein